VFFSIFFFKANHQVEDDEIERIASEVFQCFPQLQHLKSLFGKKKKNGHLKALFSFFRLFYSGTEVQMFVPRSCSWEKPPRLSLPT